METQYLRHEKIINHGTRFATCVEYFGAFWKTFATHSLRLPPNINDWRAEQFSQVLAVSISAGVRACQLCDELSAISREVRNYPKPVSISNRRENQLKNASRANSITPRVTDQRCVSCQGQAHQFRERITTAGGVGISISVSINDRTEQAGVLATAGDQQSNGSG